MKTNIVFIKKRWHVINWEDKKSEKKFLHREQAFHYAMGISEKVFVHGTNGIVIFTDEPKNKVRY